MPFDTFVIQDMMPDSLNFDVMFEPTKVKDKKYVRGLHRLGDRWLHITKGVGNLHGLRLNCRPEVSLLEIS